MFVLELELHAATQIFGTLEAQLAGSVTGRRQLSLGHAALLGRLNASVSNTPDGHGRLSENGTRNSG